MKLNKIMVIDDSKTEQFLNEVIIEKFNPDIEFVQAYDGREGLDKITEMSVLPDLILLDINMPGMNGFEFVEKFSELEYSTKIIMLSSSEQTKDRDKALSYSCVEDYILKPLSEEKIRKIQKM